MRAESVMVEFEPGVRVGLVKFESIVEELEVLAGRRVDLVTRRGLKPWVRPVVLKGAQNELPWPVFCRVRGFRVFPRSNKGLAYLEAARLPRRTS